MAQVVKALFHQAVWREVPLVDLSYTLFGIPWWGHAVSSSPHDQPITVTHQLRSQQSKRTRLQTTHGAQPHKRGSKRLA